MTKTDPPHSTARSAGVLLDATERGTFVTVVGLMIRETLDDGETVGVVVWRSEISLSYN